MAFDGDADRCFVVDEKGHPVSPSAVTALVAARELNREIGATVIHNLITSRAVPELVAERGGTPVRSRVGHSYIKALMADTGAIFGGEHSAHYYFRDFWGADSGMLAALHVLAALGEQERPLSELMADYQRYEASGEINFTVTDAEACVDAVLKSFGTRIHSIDHLDGVTVDLGDGSWFNLRMSNTEPLLRLNVEARSTEEVDEIVGLVIASSRSPNLLRRRGGHVNATQAAVDLDDVEGLLAADRDGLLRAASMAGAQVRATAAALDEGDLDALKSDQPPRTVIWVAGRGNAETAGTMLCGDAGRFGGRADRRRVRGAAVDRRARCADPRRRRPRRPCPGFGGRDRGAPRRARRRRRALRRPAARRDGGPVRRRWHPGCGSATTSAWPATWRPAWPCCRWWTRACEWTSPRWPTSSMRRRSATAPDASCSPTPPRRWPNGCRDATWCSRATTRRTLALARHGAAVLLRVAHQAVAAVGLADALVALRGGMGGEPGADREKSIFHDEQIDGPLPRRVRTFVLATDAERPVVVARVSGLDDVDVINAEDVPQVSDMPEAAVAPAAGRPEQQLAMLAVRLEMTATYLRLVRG